MISKANISEIELLQTYKDKVCMNLLKDHTTQQNIYWATDSYAHLDDNGEQLYSQRFQYFSPITLELITSLVNDEGHVISKEKYKQLMKSDKGEAAKFHEIIRPRAVKSKEEQTLRSKDKAEVFTPSWICNAQNNLIDEAWFGRKDNLFNSPDPDNPHKWINNEEKIEFPEGKDWKDYVSDMRLEITCGEAPYLCNRYDAVTGEYNENAKYRIGILDRKLRIVSENVHDSKGWILWAKIALRSTYGFEWQGDSLFLAREALFFTFAEHYTEKFGEKKFDINKSKMMPGVAYIVSWNVWQMDGITFGFPGHQDEIYHRKTVVEAFNKQLADYEKKLRELEAFSKNNLFDANEFDTPKLEKPVLEEPRPYEQFCLIKDFLKGVNLKKASLSNHDFHDDGAPKLTFESLVNKNNN